MTQLWASTCKPMNSWNPLELQDFVLIFAKFCGGGPPRPPSLNTSVNLITINPAIDLTLISLYHEFGKLLSILYNTYIMKYWVPVNWETEKTKRNGKEKNEKKTRRKATERNEKKRNAKKRKQNSEKRNETKEKEKKKKKRKETKRNEKYESP